MARRHRTFLNGAAQHLIQRGHNRVDIFRSAPDYEVFLCALAEARQRFQVVAHAYVLMTNHVHLLVTPPGPRAAGATMQSVGRRYVPYFNHRYQRTGGLFEGRYRSVIVGDERYLLACMRYIELNPVRAGLVESPGSYRWSSYRTHATGEPSSIVAHHEVYTGLGRSIAERSVYWREFCRQDVAPSELNGLRCAVYRNAPTLSRVVTGV